MGLIDDKNRLNDKMKSVKFLFRVLQFLQSNQFEWKLYQFESYVAKHIK